jgi:SAM-dependent methyltransferase
MSTEDFWERFYGGDESVWSGSPNAALVEEATDLAIGTALDLGCGQGDDAIWLAGRGWQVTGVDVSSNALARAAQRADSAGVADAINWQRHDLATSFPDGAFDLVAASFLHSPVDMPRAEILRRAAEAVAPGGTMLVIAHAGSPSWVTHDVDLHFPTNDDVLADLHLPTGEWRIDRNAVVARGVDDPDGNPSTIDDSILRMTRLIAPS